MAHVTGFLTPVRAQDRTRYIASAKASATPFKAYGALEPVECWGTDMPDGETTSFPLAIKLQPGDVVFLSWLQWPDKATADSAWVKMKADPRFAEMDIPFDGKRIMWGGFEVIFAS